MSFKAVLEKHRAAARGSRDMGDRFERLMRDYLLTDPTRCAKVVVTHSRLHWR